MKKRFSKGIEENIQVRFVLDKMAPQFTPQIHAHTGNGFVDINGFCVF